MLIDRDRVYTVGIYSYKNFVSLSKEEIKSVYFYVQSMILHINSYSECFFCCTLVEKGRGNGTSWAELVIFAA